MTDTARSVLSEVADLVLAAEKHPEWERFRAEYPLATGQLAARRLEAGTVDSGLASGSLAESEARRRAMAVRTSLARLLSILESGRLADVV